MPFIGYQLLAELVGKTETEVREDRTNKQFDLDNFKSLVEYTAKQWGWSPPGQAPKAGVIIGERRTVHTATDNVEPTLDPYLERVTQQRGETPIR